MCSVNSTGHLIYLEVSREGYGRDFGKDVFQKPEKWGGSRAGKKKWPNKGNAIVDRGKGGRKGRGRSRIEDLRDNSFVWGLRCKQGCHSGYWWGLSC